MFRAVATRCHEHAAGMSTLVSPACLWRESSNERQALSRSIGSDPSATAEFRQAGAVRTIPPGALDGGVLHNCGRKLNACILKSDPCSCLRLGGWVCENAPGTSSLNLHCSLCPFSIRLRLIKAGQDKYRAPPQGEIAKCTFRRNPRSSMRYATFKNRSG